jgi:hypothetical protein
MDIKVTKHAAQRFTERVGRIDNPPDAIRGMMKSSHKLTEAETEFLGVKDGPHTDSNFYLAQYKKRQVVMIVKNSTVVTVLKVD